MTAEPAARLPAGNPGASSEGAGTSRAAPAPPRVGQAVVEFAMVVPLLCLIVIVILHFGKVMNYWLDLNHVASEGARKAAVKRTTATASTTPSYATGSRPPSFAPAGRAPSRARRGRVCLPEGPATSATRSPSRSRSATACRSSARRSRSRHRHDAARAGRAPAGCLRMSAARGLTELAAARTAASSSSSRC